MLYQQSLKQLNAIFPKLDIKPPSKKVTVRSLIQQKQCFNLTSSDFKMLQSIETATKPLNKLVKTLRTWLLVLQQNEKARQQQQNKPISRKSLDHLQFMMADCGQIQSKSQFIQYIREHGDEVYGRSPITTSTKQYKQVLICNQIDFYNTITVIDQDQYFKELEELTEKLGILEQLAMSAGSDEEDLEEFLGVLQNEELFKKKDNGLNRVINYNLKRAMELMEGIDKIQKMVHFYHENLTYSIARCYYLCFQSRVEVDKFQKDPKKLTEIKKYLCDRQEKVFIKLHNRKIIKTLLKLEQIESKFLMSSYQNQSVTKQLIHFFTQRYQLLREKFDMQAKPLAESQFIDIYGDIEVALIELKLNNEEGQEIRNKFMELEQEVVASYVNETETGRRFLNLSNAKDRSSLARSTVKFGRDSAVSHALVDFGDDVFIKYNDQDLYNEFLQRLVQKDKQYFEKECDEFLSNIQAENGDQLEDAKNICPQKVEAFLEAARTMNIHSPQIQQIQLLVKTLTKPQISESTISKIFDPTLRIQVLRNLAQKFIEHSYKLTKLTNSSQFAKIPQNLKKFTLARQSFIKGCQRELQNIIKIAELMSRIRQKSQYQISDEMTYETFLKVLLGQKETKAYEMAFRDEKSLTPHAKEFINKNIYACFMAYLQTILPRECKSIVEDLDQIQFSVNLVNETDLVIEKYCYGIENEKESKDVLRMELARILAKWESQGEKRLKNKKSYFVYGPSEQQMSKIREIMSLCNGDNPAELTHHASRHLNEILKS